MLYNWYLRGLFESKKYQREKFQNIDPTTFKDEELLEMICEITGLTEPEVVEQAKTHIRERNPEFEWNFGEYFRDMKFELHPAIRDELRRAHFVLHNN